MKIGLVGAGGTGKTTLASTLAERLHLPFLPSVSRPVFEKWGWTEERQRSATADERYDLQRTIFKAKVKQDAENTFGVSDRTLLDHLIYLSYRCYDSIPEHIHKIYEHTVLQNLRQYNLIIYCPIYDWKIPDDGMRENNYVYRWMYDKMVYAFLVSKAIPYTYVLDISVEERVNFIMDYLR